jgi:hypothetical protein
MDDLTLKASLRAAEPYDPPMFRVGGRGGYEGKRLRVNDLMQNTDY